MVPGTAERWLTAFCANAGNPVARPRTVIVNAKATDQSVAALEVLRKENELLKQTISGAKVSIANLEQSIEAAGSIVPPPQPSAAGGAEDALDLANLQPEDYWSPAIDVPDGVAYEEEYGAISPIPDHDGTASFKYDETLWSKAEHFKVGLRRRALLQLPCSVIWPWRSLCCNQARASARNCFQDC